MTFIDVSLLMAHASYMDKQSTIAGSEIYGSDALPGWEEFDIYCDSRAEFVRFQLEFGRLNEGGPDLDLERLQELRELRKSTPEAETELRQLLKYVSYYRYMHALNVRDNPEEGVKVADTD